MKRRQEAKTVARLQYFTRGLSTTHGVAARFSSLLQHFKSGGSGEVGQRRDDVCQPGVGGDSLVMPSVQIEETPPALRRSVQHREDTHKGGELAGGQRPPLLHHQVRDVRRLPARLVAVLRPPVAAGEECAAAFERGAVEGHRHDHQQARHDQQGVSRAVGEQQPPVQLHAKRSTGYESVTIVKTRI